MQLAAVDDVVAVKGYVRLVALMTDAGHSRVNSSRCHGTLEDLARFRKWFAEYDAAAWDRQLEQDVKAGRLDALGREALREHRAGRTTTL